MYRYFLNISSTFYQYRDNTDNHVHFGHYNRDKKCSYHYILIPHVLLWLEKYKLKDVQHTKNAPPPKNTIQIQ